MGSPWVQWNSMMERWEFLFVRVRQEEIFKKSWAHCREMINDFDATGETNNSEGAAVASTETQDLDKIACPDSVQI